MGYTAEELSREGIGGSVRGADGLKGEDLSERGGDVPIVLRPPIVWTSFPAFSDSLGLRLRSVFSRRLVLSLLVSAREPNSRAVLK